MNIDFTHHPGFSTYVLLLIFAGIVMTAMAITMHSSSTKIRVLNGVFGAAYLGYGLYLAFVFQGGGYLIFFKAFILPVLLVVGAVRRQSRRSAPTTHAAHQTHPSTQGTPAAAFSAPASPAVVPPPTVPAGWYADPVDPAQIRWWDGYAWGPLASQT